jgi:hypothetical protein
MYSYSFRPTFPIFHRSAQGLLVLGITAAIFGVLLPYLDKSVVYEHLPLLTIAVISFLGFIVQHNKYNNRRELGYFFVVDLNSFHSYKGRNADLLIKWENVSNIDRDGKTLLVTDLNGIQHDFYLGHYQRIDRLRIECLMHQFWNHHLESQKIATPVELAEVS